MESESTSPNLECYMLVLSSKIFPILNTVAHTATIMINQIQPFDILSISDNLDIILIMPDLSQVLIH